MIAEIFEAVYTFIRMDILTTLGLLLVVAFLGSKIFQYFGIPQVVGFIVIGVLFGPSFLNVVPLELTEELTFVSQLALGLIGFDIGSHLMVADLKRLGLSIIMIVLFEALGTFIIVSVGVYFLTQSIFTGLIFGALASATAPAATVDVLAEYDSAGPLTTSLLAVIGLDDAIALILFSISAAFAESMLTSAELPSVLSIMQVPMLDIAGSSALGLGLGLLLNRILCRMKTQHDAMAVAIGFVILGVGLSRSLGLSLILTTMLMGFALINRNPQHTRHVRFMVEQAAPIIYVLFFALIGARLQIDLLPAMGLIGLVYILLRSFGKFSGAWLGAKLGGADPVVRNNIGFGLLSQAGVAIGLAIESAGRFSKLGPAGRDLGLLVMSVITATTFIVQIIGPIFVKFAITRAGEVGKATSPADTWASEAIPD